MPIEWNSTKDNPPLSGKEIIARNPLKPVNDYSSGKQCKIMKFHHKITKFEVMERMLDDNLSLWQYTN